jgi:hypothetical protein
MILDCTFKKENIPGILTGSPVLPYKVKPKHQAIFPDENISTI